MFFREVGAHHYRRKIDRHSQNRTKRNARKFKAETETVGHFVYKGNADNHNKQSCR